MRSSSSAFVVLALLLYGHSHAATARAAEVTTLKIGEPAPDFDLPGVDDKQYTLKDFAEAKLLLVVFTCNHCPTAQAYESRIIQLHADYRERGVALMAISPNDPEAVRLDELGYTDVGDSFDDMKVRAKERKFAFPYLFDGETQKVSRAYGVVATPQVFLFDRERKLRYVGRIDDSEVKTVTSHDARNAIEALLAGKPVPVEKTRTFGCSTKWSDKRPDARNSLEKWDKEPVALKILDEAHLTKLVKNETDRLLLISVWATTCGPCIAEMPDFVTMNRMYRERDFQMVTITIDEPEQEKDALKVLERKLVSSANFLSGISDRDKFADLLDKDWEGPVPYTLLIAPKGKVIYRKQGPMEPLEVRRAIVDFLGRTYCASGKRVTCFHPGIDRYSFRNEFQQNTDKLAIKKSSSERPTMIRVPFRSKRLISCALVLAFASVCAGQGANPPPPPAYGEPISLEQAKKVLAGAEAEAKKNDWPVAIAVVDSAGFLVAFQRLDNTQLGSVEVALQKAKTSALFRRPTKAFEDTLAMGGANAKVLKLPGALPIEGGLPIVHEGKIIGAIGVSGVKSTEDAQVATAGLEALKPRP